MAALRMLHVRFLVCTKKKVFYLANVHVNVNINESAEAKKRRLAKLASEKCRQKRKTNTELMETELKNARIELLKKDTRIELLEQQVEQLRNERDQAVLAAMANGQRRC